jgi:small subunit ribosomal protein S13
MIETKLDGKETFIKNIKKIQGIGNKRAEEICYIIGINPQDRWEEIKGIKRERCILILKELASRQENEGSLIDKNLAEYIRNNKKKQIELKTIRGIRLKNGLPSRGQRTKTNAKTAKKMRGIIFNW